MHRIRRHASLAESNRSLPESLRSRPCVRYSAPHRPCTNRQGDPAIGPDRQDGADALPQLLPSLSGQGHDVCWRCSLAVQKRMPVVVEVREHGRGFEPSHFDVPEAGSTEEVGEWFGASSLL